ncbi:MAG: HNH endonuclease [Sphingomonadales bacterium]|nr:MAG: HNH endonuclease [Sphingomonadales bacterium]
MTALDSLKPLQKFAVFDLVEQAGFDMSDWIASSNDPRGPRANPKYCYDWSFVQPGKLVIFSLWHSAMAEDAGQISHSENYRANADFHQRNGGKVQWVTRGRALDDALKAAASENLPIRVIVVDGVRRRTEDPASPSSTVQARNLDPEPWHLQNYNWNTGDFTLVRGAGSTPFADQFDLASAVPEERREIQASAFVRDPRVRREVLVRAQGRCELCGAPGFPMASGKLYLETHHIVPLAAGGPDSVRTVIALCPNDHRRAHYGDDALTQQASMIAIVREYA